MTYQEYTRHLDSICGGTGGHEASVNRFMSQESPQYPETVEWAKRRDDAYHEMMGLVKSKDAAKYGRQYESAQDDN